MRAVVDVDERPISVGLDKDGLKVLLDPVSSLLIELVIII
jgi:hypothetical protein